MKNLQHDAQTSTGSETHPAQRFVIRRLRQIVPARPIHWLEAERIAATQGRKLLALAQQAGLSPTDFVATLPVVRVESDSSLPDFRASYWDEYAEQWVIVIGKELPEAERHFSILHEFKRILDHGNEPRLYDPRYVFGHVQAEMAGDHFASCVLLPADKVRAAVKAGRTSSEELANEFNVTPLRAKKRLSDLNLL